jgi:hypothetical protein
MENFKTKSELLDERKQLEAWLQEIENKVWATEEYEAAKVAFEAVSDRLAKAKHGLSMLYGKGLIPVTVTHVVKPAKKPAPHKNNKDRADVGQPHYNGPITARDWTELVVARQCGNGSITNKTIERELQKISDSFARASGQKGFDPRSNASWNMCKMEQEGLVARTEQVVHESKLGRGQIVWAVTPKGIEYFAAKYPNTAAARVAP